MSGRMKGPFEGRRRWKSKEPKRERPAGARVVTMAAVLRSLILLMFGILVIQLINLQVIHGASYKEQSAINAVREVPIPAARGLIYDRNGKPVVENAARFSVTITPSDLPDAGGAAVYAQLSGVIGMPVSDIQATVQQNIKDQGDFSPALIKTDLDRDTALVLMELEPHAPGMKVQVDPARRYLTGDQLSHVLGYVGPISAEQYAELSDQGYGYNDFVGQTGVESTYEAKLRGKSGAKLVEVDAAGRELRTISERPPIDGANVVLSLDLDLQQQVTNILKQYSQNSENAAAAVMDVHTGEILSLVSLPSYDANVFSGKLSQAQLDDLINAPGKPLVDHAIGEQYPPGSTFKTIVGSAALQEGIAGPTTTITSRGYITIENEFDPNVVYVYPDWAPLGTLDFYGGVAMSSDVYFYYLAGGFADDGFRGLGQEKIAEYARDFGLGSPTGIDIPGEASGLVPDSKWKQDNIGEPWVLGDTYNYGIGQGYVSATPMQMLDAVTAIANGGQLVTPHVVKEYRDSMGNIYDPLATQVRSRLPVEPGYLQIMRDAMRQSVTAGVARNAASSAVAVTGKTGTAEFGDQHADGTYDTHGWFVGFAPSDDPQIAVMVFVQHGSGGNDASPAAAQIFNYYFGHETPSAPGEATAAPAPTEEPSTGEPAQTPFVIPTPLGGDFVPNPAPIITDAPPAATPAPTDTPEPVPTATAEPPPDTPTPGAIPSPVAERLYRRLEGPL
jgi:penicillin-binding protein 2